MNYLKEISLKANSQFNDKYYILEDSSLYKEDIEKITDIYNKLNKLVNHTIALNELEYYSMILTLSTQGSSAIKNLNEKRGVKNEY